MACKTACRLAAAATMLLPAAPALTQDAAAEPGAVQVQRLEQVEPFQVGARTGIAFAMPVQQWRGSNAAIATALISDLPQAGASPVLNRLAASVLLSPSAPPAGGKGNGALTSLRLAGVYRLGALDAVIDLAERSPGGLSDPENAAIASRAFLALGREDKACETAARLQKGRGAVFWLKLRAFCLARQGKTAAAELSADLATEADPDDTDFLLALNRMLRKDTSPVKPISALELAMARAAGAPVDLAEAPLALHSAMVHTKGLQGIAAARHVAQTGMLEPQVLARLYLSWPGANAQPAAATASTPASAGNGATADPGKSGPDLTGPDQSGPDDGGAALLQQALEAQGDARAALLYQSAAKATDDTVRARAIAEALRHEGSFAGFLFSARLYAPLLQKLTPDDAQEGSLRTLFSYALLAAGRPKQARLFAQPGADAPDPAMARLFALDGTRPLALPKAADGDATSTAAATRLLYSDLMALGALGKPLAPPARQFLFTHVADTDEFAPCAAGARAAIRYGAARKVRAATVLRAALMLADSGFDQAAPECGAVAIRALARLGQGRAAHDAALEMMLGPRWRALDHAHG